MTIIKQDKMRIFSLAALIFGILAPTTIQAAFDPDILAQKDSYVKNLASNASIAYGYRRLIVVGQKIATAGVFTVVGMIPGIVLGDLMLGLGTLGYSSYLWATFVSIAKLDKIAEQHPRILTEKDEQIIQIGKDIIKGPGLRFIEKKLAIKSATKNAAQKLINQLKIFYKKKDTKLIANYLERFIDVTTYEKLKRQRQEAIKKRTQKKGLGILKKITNRAMNLINKLADHPALRLSMARKKRRMENFKKSLNLKAQKLLQKTATDLFEKIDSIKGARFASRIEELIEESEKMESEEN